MQTAQTSPSGGKRPTPQGDLDERLPFFLKYLD